MVEGRNNRLKKQMNHLRLRYMDEMEAQQFESQQKILFDNFELHGTCGILDKYHEFAVTQLCLASGRRYWEFCLVPEVLAPGYTCFVGLSSCLDTRYAPKRECWEELAFLWRPCISLDSNLTGWKVGSIPLLSRQYLLGGDEFIAWCLRRYDSYSRLSIRA